MNGKETPSHVIFFSHRKYYDQTCMLIPVLHSLSEMMQLFILYGQLNDDNFINLPTPSTPLSEHL